MQGLLLLFTVDKTSARGQARTAQCAALLDVSWTCRARHVHVKLHELSPARVRPRPDPGPATCAVACARSADA